MNPCPTFVSILGLLWIEIHLSFFFSIWHGIVCILSQGHVFTWWYKYVRSKYCVMGHENVSTTKAGRRTYVYMTKNMKTKPPKTARTYFCPECVWDRKMGLVWRHHTFLKCARQDTHKYFCPWCVWDRKMWWVWRFHTSLKRIRQDGIRLQR